MIYYSMINDINEKNNTFPLSQDEGFSNQKILDKIEDIDVKSNENMKEIFTDENIEPQTLKNEIFKENKLNRREKTNSPFVCEHKLQVEEKFLWYKEDNEISKENCQKKEENIANTELKEENESGYHLDNFFSLVIKPKKESHNNSDFNSSDEMNMLGKNSFDLSEFCILCEKKNEIEKHKHGPGCGHSIINHKGHIDYIVEGILHYPHEQHCDDHGRVVFI